MAEKLQSSSSLYRTVSPSLTPTTHPEIIALFQHLTQLEPMDKNGPMSGRCGLQTDQMEEFLSQNFGFKNILGQYIVQGVRSFALDKSLYSMDPNTIIHFPFDTNDSFMMKVQEIIDWQHSYRVYADQGIQGMDKSFLHRALQGQSQDGEEAFRMKFVIRISTCPILMEFDAKIIPRKLNEDWPHRIKLVSVSGIDFAGRKHDVGDILYYIANWRDVFIVDSTRDRDQPALLTERDFAINNDGSHAKLHKDRVLDSLMRMARLRLRACDEEGVQIVVETGIGLGVFSGNRIGIDGKIRTLSAKAIRKVLQEDGSSYKNIRAIIFALPIFNNPRIPDTFDDFVNQFHKKQYTGPIPVLIADQDMHRLTVAIARQGFTVSELNPADSHGVFGEYWQNKGPAVEEKLALTTVGLLIQHHLINQEVLNLDNYRIIEVPGTYPLNYHTTISADDDKSGSYCCKTRF